MRHMMHDGLVGVLTSIIKDVGVLETVVVKEAKGLRAADASRPGDVEVLEFFSEGRHRVIDAVVTTVYRNVILKHASSIPDYPAKQVQDRKFNVDRASSQPIATIHGGPHVLVPFAIEDRGHVGAHALALLRALAIVALDKSIRPSPLHTGPLDSMPPHWCPCGCNTVINDCPPYSI
jgi:hypothetical protein